MSSRKKGLPRSLKAGLVSWVGGNKSHPIPASDYLTRKDALAEWLSVPVLLVPVKAKV